MVTFWRLDCQGVIEDLPVEDSSIDAIISNCVVNLSLDKDRVYREAFRALKAGARESYYDRDLGDLLRDKDRSPTLR